MGETSQDRVSATPTDIKEITYSDRVTPYDDAQCGTRDDISDINFGRGARRGYIDTKR